MEENYCYNCGDGGCIKCDSSYFLYDEREEKRKKIKERAKAETKNFNEWKNLQKIFYSNK
jgi:radical SAM superfamily enzyme